jgi:hypothetical protein
MSLAKTIFCGIALGGWVACSFGAEAASSSQNDWHRRVLRDSRVKKTATVVQDENPLLVEPDASFDSIQLDPAPSETLVEGNVGTPGGCASCGGGDSCGGCGACDSCAGACDPYPPMGCMAGDWLHNFSLSAGVEGFKGPADQGHGGNFGFNEGFNHGAALGGPWGIGYQLGLRAVQSNLSGNEVDGESHSARKQIFFTGGLFRRAVCGGWQGGLAFDLMNDDYYANANLNQLRVELSWAQPGWREIGFWGAMGGKNDRIRVSGDVTSLTLEQTDLFAFFYRRYFQTGGEGRFWAGFTGKSDGMIGSELRVPFAARWAVEGGFNYLIPSESHGTEGIRNESWNVAMHLVWYPGRSAHCAGREPFHPLFNVADNGTFMVDVRD